MALTDMMSSVQEGKIGEEVNASSSEKAPMLIGDTTRVNRQRWILSPTRPDRCGLDGRKKEHPSLLICFSHDCFASDHKTELKVTMTKSKIRRLSHGMIMTARQAQRGFRAMTAVRALAKPLQYSGT